MTKILVVIAAIAVVFSCTRDQSSIEFWDLKPLLNIVLEVEDRQELETSHSVFNAYGYGIILKKTGQAELFDDDYGHSSIWYGWGEFSGWNRYGKKISIERAGIQFTWNILEIDDTGLVVEESRNDDQFKQTVRLIVSDRQEILPHPSFGKR